MPIRFRTFDPEDPVDFDTLSPPESPSTTSSDITCTFTFTKTINRVLASASRVLTIPAINTGRARPSDTLNFSDIISKSHLRSFTLKELQAATYNFSNKFIVGKGGFGNVYRGLVPDGSLVAIKRLAASSGQGLEQFEAEIEITSRVRHQNLIRIIGFCQSEKPKECIVVYPYKVNGVLRSRLRKLQSRPPLDWPTRKRILLGAAQGLSCLHENGVIHRDIKSSNILLDENLEACIGDCGIAKVFHGKEQPSSSEVQNHAVLRFATEREMATNRSSYEDFLTNHVIGTYGYMAPEYAAEGIYSVKIDVYSFGALILEVVTGRSTVDIERMGNSKDMPFSWIKSCLKENNLDMLIDSDLLGNCSEDDVKKIIQLGLACTQHFPEKRPSMHQVVQVLEGAAELEDIGADTDYKMDIKAHGLYSKDMDTASSDLSVDFVQANDVSPLSTHELLPIKSLHAHPPPAVEVPQQNMIESLNITKVPSRGSVTFHGYIVPSCLLHPLEHLQEIEGDFWSGSVCLDTEVNNDMMTLLGRAARLLDRTWSSLSMAELKFLISSVNAGRAFNFRLNKMKLVADEAQKMLDCNDIIEQREHLRAKLREVELKIEQQLGNRDLDLDVKSFIKP